MNNLMDSNNNAFLDENIIILNISTYLLEMKLKRRVI